MSPGTSCVVCAAGPCFVADVPYPFVRQSDFTNVKTSGRIAACPACSAIFHCVEPEDVRRIEEQFADEAYARSEQTGQTVPMDSSGHAASRCALQADILASCLRHAPQAILDIGCYDGELLVELERRFSTAALHGFDASAQMARHFPDRAPFRFWSPRLDAVPGPFDLICISHTLMYVQDLPALAREINRLLAPEGLLFLQMPDIAANPLSLLMGDQYLYFTADSLRSTLGRFGLTVTAVENPWFPREIVAIGKRAARSDAPATDAVEILRRIISLLAGKARNLRGLPARMPLSVLGTTFSAAFVDNVASAPVLRFVDENPAREGTVFRAKPVVHPRALADEDVLVVPYGPSGVKIQERFARQYPVRTVVV